MTRIFQNFNFTSPPSFAFCYSSYTFQAHLHLVYSSLYLSIVLQFHRQISQTHRPLHPPNIVRPPSTALNMAQRESYQLPEHRTSGPSASQSQSQSASGGAYNYSANATLVTQPHDSNDPGVTYRCGECALPVKLYKGDTIRCSHCGHRVMYKERTRRMVQFEAR